MILVFLLAAMTLTACSDPPAPAALDSGRSATGDAGTGFRVPADPIQLDKRPTVKVGSAEGNPGDVVSLDVALVDGQGVVVATATDLRYQANDARVALGPNGQPDCDLEPSLGSAGPVRKQIFARERVADGQAVLRVGILGVDNANPLPDGKLFACRFRIAAAATAGVKSIYAATEASDARARAVGVNVSTGEIVVN